MEIAQNPPDREHFRKKREKPHGSTFVDLRFFGDPKGVPLIWAKKRIFFGHRNCLENRAKAEEKRAEAEKSERLQKAADIGDYMVRLRQIPVFKHIAPEKAAKSGGAIYAITSHKSVLDRMLSG